jgi:hypothetical protein
LAQKLILKTRPKDIINIGATAGIRKDLLDLLESKLRILTDENAELRAKVSRFEIENRQLKTLAQNSQPFAGALQEFAGVLWKRTSNGYGQVPYCPQCHNNPLMFGIPPTGCDPMLWQCSRFEFMANFAGRPK